MTDSRGSTVGFFVSAIRKFAYLSVIREKYSSMILSILLKNGIEFGKNISY